MGTPFNGDARHVRLQMLATLNYCAGKMFAELVTVVRRRWNLGHGRSGFDLKHEGR